MHSFTPRPARDALPWPETSSQGRRRQVGDVSLTDDQVASFDALLHDVCPQAPRVQADHIAHVARWLMSQPPAAAQRIPIGTASHQAPAACVACCPTSNTTG